MSLLFIIKLSSYIYLLASILLPAQIVDLTSHFLSLVFIQSVDSSNIITHVSKCIVLLARFVVLYTILGGNAVYSIYKSQVTVNNRVKQKKKKEKIEQKPSEVIMDEKRQTATNIAVVNDKPIDNSTPLHTTADFILQTKKAVPTTAIPIINNHDSTNNSKNISIESSTTNTTNNNIISISDCSTASEEDTATSEPTAIAITNNTSETNQLKKEDKDTIVTLPPQQSSKEAIVKPFVVQGNRDTEQFNNDKTKEAKSASSSTIIKSDDDEIITTTAAERPSVVEFTLAKDQMTKDNNIPTAINHVISNDTITITSTAPKETETFQPEKKTETSVPPSKSDEDPFEDEHFSTTTTSTTVTPPAEPTVPVDSNKEAYYNNIIEKGSDIKSFSESVKNIFDGPPSTPLPQKHDSIVLPLSLNNNDNHTYHDDNIDMNHNKIMQQPTIEEMMSTTTPALTPQAGSTSSRRSSTTSNNTSLPALKNSRIQTALQKLSGPRQPPPPPPQQQTMDSIIVEASNSSISKSKSRFSSIRLTRKKSSGSVLPHLQSEDNQHQRLGQPSDIEVKPSTSTKLNNKLKKTTKRLSKLFS